MSLEDVFLELTEDEKETEEREQEELENVSNL